ncbi:sensor histidine kinase [Pedobacter africanus]|uniref:sensor histidine kinase n=1 Tax=Pedobacter africanus TaxID=151894 RepID=UPI001F1E6535|nr:sensor histidine kinase [Pedobacter africanus]
MSFNTKAQPILLDSSYTYGNIGKQVSYFEDKEAGITFDGVKVLEKRGKFQQSKSEVLNLGNTKSAFWVKITYKSAVAGRDYLVIDVPNIEHIDCYVETNTQLIHKSAGSIQPSVPGVITRNNYIIPLPEQGQNPGVSTIWLRVKTNNILLLPIKMATSENFVPGLSVKNSMQSIYIGILLTLFVFNIFLFFSIGDRTYLYYSIYVISLAVYVVGYLRGYSYLLGDQFRIMLNLYPHLFLSISIISGILFSSKFLNLHTLFPSFSKVCKALIGLSIVMLLTSAAGLKSISAILAQFLSISSAIILWTYGILAYRKGHAPAKYFILAWTFIAFTIILAVISMEGILPFRDFSFQLVPIGSTIELLLLAFALGDRYRTIIRNEQLVRDENLLLVQTQNQRLEKLVEDRTLKLSESIVQLEASNAVKNKLFSIIAHDLRSPFASLVSIFSLKDMDLLSLDELKMLLNENKKNIDTIHNTLNNLLYWAKSQMEGLKNQPTVFDLKLMAEDLVLVYSPLIQAKGIAVNLQAPQHPLVYADENQIQLVLRNLIDNAIKFTPPSHSIGISLTKNKTSIEVCVNNTTSNSNELNIESITNTSAFEATSGTGHEKGIGLGLHLCREYLKGNGSELKVNISGRSVSFCFQLPKPGVADTISL